MPPAEHPLFSLRRIGAQLASWVSSAPVRLLLTFVWVAWLLDLPAREGPPWRVFAQASGMAGLIVLLYALQVWLLERRGVAELAPRAALPHLFWGLLLGAAVSLPHAAKLAAGNGFSVALASAPAFLGLALLAAASEEVLFRGALLRISEAFLGSLAALLLSAGIFALLHAPGIRIETFAAGLATGSCFLLTRKLWLSIGGHFAHNFLLDLISSGASRHVETTGNPWETAFLCSANLLVVAVFLTLAYRRGALRWPHRGEQESSRT